MANRMKLERARLLSAMLICGFATASICVPDARAQQGMPPPAQGETAAVTTDRSLTVENDKVNTSAEHHYNSPAERAKDDLLITEVKSSLADKGISNGYPVAVDCDHGTIELSGVVASADDARRAQSIAMSTNGVVGVKSKLTWR